MEPAALLKPSGKKVASVGSFGIISVTQKKFYWNRWYTQVASTSYRELSACFVQKAVRTSKMRDERYLALARSPHQHAHDVLQTCTHP